MKTLYPCNPDIMLDTTSISLKEKCLYINSVSESSSEELGTKHACKRKYLPINKLKNFMWYDSTKWCTSKQRGRRKS